MQSMPLFQLTFQRQYVIHNVMKYLSTMASKSSLNSTELELIDRVHARFQRNDPDKFHFFYTTASPFSNFHPCSITNNGFTFHSNEQYMMYHKAKLFDDNVIARKILAAETPGHCKALGRLVKNFDQQTWDENRTPIVSNGVYLKFVQDEQLKQALLKHYGSLFVEAAVNDCIWGVGLRENDHLITKRSNWRGLNLLGYILTDVAHRIHDEDKNPRLSRQTLFALFFFYAVQ